MSVPSMRNATRTWARHSSRFSPRSPVETTSMARMLRSEVWACFRACCAASSEDFLELPTSSMILTTATGPSCVWSVGCRRDFYYMRALATSSAAADRGAPAAGLDLAGGDARLQRRKQPRVGPGRGLGGGRVFRQELLECRGDRG